MKKEDFNEKELQRFNDERGNATLKRAAGIILFLMGVVMIFVYAANQDTTAWIWFGIILSIIGIITASTVPSERDTIKGIEDTRWREKFAAERELKRQEEKQKIEELKMLLEEGPEESETGIGKYLFIDCETTGLIKYKDSRIEDFNDFPRVVQLAWLLTDKDGKCVNQRVDIVKNKGVIPKKAEEIHGISTEMMRSNGVNPKHIYEELIEDVKKADLIIMHNEEYDHRVIAADMLRHKLNDLSDIFYRKKAFCTMLAGTDICKIPGRYDDYKYPKLTELLGKLYFNKTSLAVDGAHDAMVDVRMTYCIFFKMLEEGFIEPEFLLQEST